MVDPDIQAVASTAAADVKKKSHVKLAKETIKADCVCPICHDILLNPVTPPCGHNLCDSCFKELKSKHNYNLKCPMCQRKIQDKNLSVNLVMSDILKKFGGSSYVRRLEKDAIVKQHKLILNKYLRSSRYDLISSMLENYLEEHEIVDHADIIAHYSDYDATELDFILCNSFLGTYSDIIVHGNKLINKTKVVEYMKNNHMTTESEVIIMLSWLMNDKFSDDNGEGEGEAEEFNKVIEFISNRHRSSTKNPLYIHSWISCIQNYVCQST